MNLTTESASVLGQPLRHPHLCCQGNTGREDVLFLRLYLLQSLLGYIEGNDVLAKQQLDKVCVVCFFVQTSVSSVPAKDTLVYKNADQAKLVI